MLLPALNPSDVVGMQIGLFGEAFLAEMSSRPLFADGGTKNDAVIRGRHSLKQKQRLARISTPLNG